MTPPIGALGVRDVALEPSAQADLRARASANPENTNRNTSIASDEQAERREPAAHDRADVASGRGRRAQRVGAVRARVRRRSRSACATCRRVGRRQHPAVAGGIAESMIAPGSCVVVTRPSPTGSASRVARRTRGVDSIAPADRVACDCAARPDARRPSGYSPASSASADEDRQAVALTRVGDRDDRLAVTEVRRLLVRGGVLRSCGRRRRGCRRARRVAAAPSLKLALPPSDPTAWRRRRGGGRRGRRGRVVATVILARPPVVLGGEVGRHREVPVGERRLARARRSKSRNSFRFAATCALVTDVGIIA